jgi:Bacterial PH domain
MLQLPNLRPDEKIEVVLKRHWIVYVILTVYFLLGLFLTFTIWWFFGVNLFMNFLVVLFWMGFSLFLFVEWLNHELDMFIVTNNRVVWVEQISFLDRVVSECNLWQVQEVNSSTKWFFANILNYGTVKIQTAGNATNFAMDYCPTSLENARKILNIVDNYRDKHGWSKSLDGMGKWHSPSHEKGWENGHEHH